MFEVLHHYLPKIEASTVLDRLTLQDHEYFVVSCHREENVDSPRLLAGLVETMNRLARDSGHRVIVSTHPRTRKRFDLESIELDPKVELLKPLGFTDYIKLQLHSPRRAFR